MNMRDGSMRWVNTGRDLQKTGLQVGDWKERSGVVLGEVLQDRQGFALSPLHSQFAKRYQPVMYWIRPEWKPLWLRWFPFGWEPQIGKYTYIPVEKVNRQVVTQSSYLIDDSDNHVLVVAPARSGKSLGVVVPSLLAWKESVVVFDINEEDWRLTAEYRKMTGQTVLKFAPGCQDGSGACWNPLDEIRLFTMMDMHDARSIMAIVCNPKGRESWDHFSRWATDFLAGLALHLAYKGSVTMHDIATCLYGLSQEDEAQMCVMLMQQEHDPEGRAGWADTEGKLTHTHPLIAYVAKTMLDKEQTERSSILKTARAYLLVFLDPIVAKNTSRSDFKVRDLMHSDKPMSCYYVVNPCDIDRMRPITQLFFNMVIQNNTRQFELSESEPSIMGNKHRLLMLLDDAGVLGPINLLPEKLEHIADCGIKCVFIYQSICQLAEDNNVQMVKSNCLVQVFFALKDMESAEYLALTSHYCVTPDEALRLGVRDIVVIAPSEKGRVALYGKKVEAYADMTMRKEIGLSL